MLEFFPYIEADFQREYGIDLTRAELSWRRFLALIGGLSAESVFFYVLNNRIEYIEKTTDVAADMVAMLSKRKGK